jgi:hypothetical protein
MDWGRYLSSGVSGNTGLKACGSISEDGENELHTNLLRKVQNVLHNLGLSRFSAGIATEYLKVIFCLCILISSCIHFLHGLPSRNYPQSTARKDLLT